MEVRHLKAPKLGETNLGQRVLAHRPCRHGPPQTWVERRGRGRQLIGHNYGHAGSGWTLAPGAVRHVNGLLLEALGREKGDAKQQPIHIIGAGVIGLFSAYDLLKRGHTNVTVIGEQFEELTSHNAGGLFCPIALEIEHAEDQALIDRIGFHSYQVYGQIAAGKHPDFPSECAKFMSAYFDVGTTQEYDAYVESGVMKAPREVLVQFDSSPRQRPMVVFDDAIFIQVRAIMLILRQFLQSNGVKFTQRRVHSLESLTHEVLLNCTGLGAKELCGDERMFSMQGHLFLLRDQNPADLDYMFIHWFPVGQTEGGQVVKRCFYLFPKRSSTADERAVGVLGGTFVENADERSPNVAEFDLLLKNVRAFLEGEI